MQQLVKNTYPQENLNISNDHVKNVLAWATARIGTLDELITVKYAFLWILPSKYDPSVIDKQLLGKFLHDLESLTPYDQTHLKQCLRDFSTKNNVKFAMLMKMLRSVLSGLAEGPSVAEILHLLGKHQSLMRIREALR